MSQIFAVPSAYVHSWPLITRLFRHVLVRLVCNIGDEVSDKLAGSHINDNLALKQQHTCYMQDRPA